MENQTFRQEIKEVLCGDNVIMIPAYKGRTWTLEGEGGKDPDLMRGGPRNRYRWRF